jgi:hypothetical protein
MPVPLPPDSTTAVIQMTVINTLATGTIFGLAAGVVSGLIAVLETPLGGSVSYVLAFTAWGQWLVLSRFWWPVTGRMPWSVITFLDDAYDRGVLRQAGAVYQFRHDRLQDHLSRAL